MTIIERTAASGGAARPVARTVMRFNAYAAIALGIATLFLAAPLGRGLHLGGPAFPAIAGSVLILFGIDEVTVAVGRRVRMGSVLPFAAIDVVVSVAALVALIAGGPALSPGARTVIALGAVVFGSFAYAEVRAMRTL